MANRKNIGIEIGSTCIFASGVFALISLFTYHSTDPSFLNSARGAGIANACGRVGAFLSATFLDIFGMGAFLFPAALFFVATTVYKREGFPRLMSTLGGMAICVSSFTVFISLQWKYWSFRGASLLTGGALGTWISDQMIHLLNPVGASLVAFLIFCIALGISTPLSIAQIGARILGWFSRRFWYLAKVITTFGVYLAGVLAMKMAYAVGNAIRKGMSRVTPVPVGPSVGPSVGVSLAGSPQKRSLPAPVPATVLPVLAEVSEAQEAEDAEEVEEADEEVRKADPKEESIRAGGIQILPREADPALKAAPQKLEKPAKKVRKGNDWQLPTIEFLKNPPQIESTVDRERLIANSQILKQKFADFGIEGEVTAVRPGPVITLYEFKPGPGIKVSRIAALADDLSMALSAQSVRILAPLPGKSVVGIEIPSETREMVYLREFLQHPDFYGSKHLIPIIMGKEIGGQTYLSDLARMPHLLCAGQTGSGKSVFMNGLICSLFYRFTPDELRMILVDPKFIEFRAYQDIPHLLLPVVDDPKQASIALKWAVREMERRYRILAKMGSRNLASFNQKVDELGVEGVREILFSEANSSEVTPAMSGSDWIEAFEPDENGNPQVNKLPFIVVIIDELADLMMIAKKEVEISIARIAQKARAAGIHLVIATQRPSTDVITGLIKANLPSRVSFQLASYVDSKTILDRAGAERLLGQGDMLFIPPGVSQNLRLHGAFLDDDEIHKVTSFLKSQGKPIYRDEILMADEEEEGRDGGEGEEAGDALFDEAVELVKRSGHASASFLQRHFKIGYNRAARLIETMEARGIVGPQDGARPREVLIS